MKKFGSLIFFIIVVTSITTFGFIRQYRQNFDGVVQKVDYDQQDNPTVTIKNIDYFLSGYGWHFALKKIEAGDRLIKKENSLNLFLVKRNQRDTVNLYRK